MKTSEFIKNYDPCRGGREFAEQFETMGEVWQSCQRHDWLLWILKKHAPLTKEQSVRLAISFAESALVVWEDETDQRPALAVQVAKNWLSDPSVANEKAAIKAELAANQAARARWLAREKKAAETAATAAWAASTTSVMGSAGAAGIAAVSAWVAGAVTESDLCHAIRSLIPNPFEQ